MSKETTMRTLIARLFDRKFAPPSPRRPRPQFRPACEVLEGRDVPAAYTWTGLVSTDATVAANWHLSTDPWPDPATSTPGPGDDVTFVLVGHNPLVDCTNFGLPDPNEEYHAVYVGPGYDAKITLSHSLKTQILDLESGIISQPGNQATGDNTDITVTGPDPDPYTPAFQWRGTTLNDSGHSANITVKGSSTTG